MIRGVPSGQIGRLGIEVFRRRAISITSVSVADRAVLTIKTFAINYRNRLIGTDGRLYVVG